jgi:hypothetical protein
MIDRVCDRCGQPVADGSLRFTAKIQVFAAYDPLDISFDDLTRDHSAEIKRLLDECKDLTEEQLMKDVYVEFNFDLCPPCQKAYIKDPLPVAR